jgi:hypothetical protein
MGDEIAREIHVVFPVEADLFEVYSRLLDAERARQRVVRRVQICCIW